MMITSTTTAITTTATTKPCRSSRTGSRDIHSPLASEPRIDDGPAHAEKGQRSSRASGGQMVILYLPEQAIDVFGVGAEQDDRFM